MNAVSKKNVEADAESSNAAVTLAEFFQYASMSDCFLLLIGTICSIASGLCQPTFTYLFGTALNDLNGSNISTEIDKLVLYLLLLGIGNWFVLTVASGCWGIAGERQAQMYSDKYVSAVLSQEIGWFDSVGANQLATKLADMSGHLRDGLTEKFSDLIQFVSQVFGCIIVGLALDPYVALIMFACKKNYFISRVFA